MNGNRFPSRKLLLGVCFVIFFTVTLSISSAQSAPEIEWQKCLGGSWYDQAHSIQQTSDGGYIIAGYSGSDDGDVTESHYDDVWIVRLDASRDIEWQKSLGGSGYDYANSIQQTSDGGYIVAGVSNSNDGDTTEFHDQDSGWDGFHGDAWIVKLYANGNINWQKSLGGSWGDGAYSVQQISDGGYIVAGSTESNDGDVIGNHGNSDFWVMKLDKDGKIVWQKCIGGSGDDWAYSVQQTSDGGYIVAGESGKIGGDVTENNGETDWWIVKLDSSGGIEWQKSIGGSDYDYANSIQQTSDGGYIVTGNYDNGQDSDSLIVKLDKDGMLKWQKFLGGSGYDDARSIQQTSDGGYIVAGSTSLDDAEVTGDYGDCWVAKLDENGNIIWEKSLGGSGSDLANSIQQTSDFGYIIAGFTESNDGDVIGNHGSSDFWVVKINSTKLMFNVTPSKIRITDNVQFNVSESVSGTQSGIIWEFGDGLTDKSGQSVVNHSYSKPGSYMVNLTIIDSTGAPKKTSQIVNVTIPVLLVHGWGSSSDMWQGMSAALQKEGFEVWNFDYKSSNTADPRTISPKLAANITERRSDLSYNGQKYTGKIDVICHSMGAVVSRLYMEKDDGGIHGKDVRQWIGIAPAHGGAASADTLGVVKYTNPVLYFLRWAYDPALSELKTTSSTINSLGPLSPTTKYWVIAGWNPTQSPEFGSGFSATLAKNETGSYYWTYSGDMIVATQQSYNKNMEFEAFPPVSGNLGGSPAYEFDHTHICNSPKVIAYVIDCLKDINKHSSKQIPPEEKVNYYTFFKKSVEGALGTVKKLITLPLSVPVFGSSNGESSQMMAMSNTGATVHATEDNVLYVLLDWDQGDVDMSLISPSGVEYTEDSHPDNVWFLEEENSITAIVVNPESGDWKSNLDPVSYPGQDIVYTLTSILRTSSESEIMPFANFTANVTEGYVPLSVQFTDKSENVTEWNWDFGDADTSTDPSPTHTYYTAGNYTVNLTVSNTYGTDSKLSTITVLEKTIVPVANFSAQPTSGKAPLKVYFTDQSTGTPTKWKWSFGGGITSFQQNPVHKYSAAGKYTVTFTTTNAKGSNTVTETDYIKVISKPVANFTSSVTSGKASLNVKFTDTSTGTPSGWIWEFGDGSKSFVENPTHKYSEAETYTVNLTVKNAAGRNTVTKTKYIKVITKPAANFTSSVTSGKAPLNVKFTDISTGTPSGWIWEFGDGLKSFVENPTHKYSKAGTYTVNLTVKNAAGRGTVTRTEYIKVV
jgi:PKD repeat protein